MATSTRTRCDWSNAMSRKEFLSQFLGALGAIKIVWGNCSPDEISGRVIYDLEDPEEFQGFCWHCHESDTPNSQVYDLTKLLNDQGLLDIDKIRLPRSNLMLLYNEAYGAGVIESEFSKILDSLDRIEVRMVDDDEETDMFFIHE